MNNYFFSFIKPYLSYIDEGHFFREPFRWLYTLIAVWNLIVPFYTIYAVIDGKLFDLIGGVTPKSFFVFLLLWAIIAFVSWVSFQLWWIRREQLRFSSSTNDEFVATPAYAHLIQTLGEWLGTWISIVGFALSVFNVTFFGGDLSYLYPSFALPSFGVLSILFIPVYGMLIIATTRFIAEQIKGISAIANNTKKSKVS